MQNQRSIFQIRLHLQKIFETAGLDPHSHMRFFVLDTNILISLFSKKGSVRTAAFLKKLHKRRSALATCGPVLAEFYRGIERKDAERYSSYLSDFKYLHSAQNIYENAGILAHGLDKKGKSTPLMDCLIAEIAKHHDATLVTSDRDFKRFSKLDVKFF